ncbi:NAD(P)-binding protein [Pleurostoma richardsiae]|uniref:NAD(P)-binding protein n=1 Tax=Pleurostoma richardsiae TaxID=41990 RepID=A0AA38R8I2_9PEZI|nr:NAD(P)-binding protein [Pleurostoma richardsiae]
MKVSAFNPDKAIPRLDGKVILITGGNVGIGKETAIQLSKHSPSEVWVASRSRERTQPALDEIQAAASFGVSVRFLQLDLTSFDSIKAAARTFLASASRLDTLICNAGVLGGPPGMTKDGYELRFGTNHIGHALLVKLLTPLLLKTAGVTSARDVRVVMVASEGHKWVPKEGIHIEKMKTDGAGLSAPDLYCESKLANVLYGQELARRFPQFTSVPIDPGNVKTGLFTSNGGGLLIRVLNLGVHLIGVSVQDGAKNHLWAATSNDVVSGEYYVPVGEAGKGGPFSKDDALRKKLWEWTEKELEGHSI